MGNEKAQVRTLVCFFFLLFLFVCVWCGNDQGFVHFLHIDAKSPPAFPNINGPMLDEANRRY